MTTVSLREPPGQPVQVALDGGDYFPVPPGHHALGAGAGIARGVGQHRRRLPGGGQDAGKPGAGAGRERERERGR